MKNAMPLENDIHLTLGAAGFICRTFTYPQVFEKFSRSADGTSHLHLTVWTAEALDEAIVRNETDTHPQWVEMSISELLTEFSSEGWLPQ